MNFIIDYNYKRSFMDLIKKFKHFFKGVFGKEVFSHPHSLVSICCLEWTQVPSCVCLLCTNANMVHLFCTLLFPFLCSYT